MKIFTIDILKHLKIMKNKQKIKTKKKDTEVNIDTYLKYLSLKELDILTYFDIKEPDEIYEGN